jgi:phage-related protein
MALNVFVPPVGPSPGTENTPEFRILESEFGDGYSQSTRDGLNHIRQVRQLRWDTLTPDQANAIEGFILAQGGDTPFLYAMTDDVQRQWRCKKYTRTNGTPVTISAEFREDFSLQG